MRLPLSISKSGNSNSINLKQQHHKYFFFTFLLLHVLLAAHVGVVNASSSATVVDEHSRTNGAADSATTRREVLGTADKQPRIVNGNLVDPPDRYPFVVSVQGDNGKHRCGGSLVALDVVLTAAHCKPKALKDQVQVFVKSEEAFHNDTTTTTPSPSTESSFKVFPIASVVQHPDYNALTFEYDFALIRIDFNVSGTDTEASLQHSISTSTPIALDDGSVELIAGTDLLVLGWGQSTILRGTILDYIDQEDCKKVYDFHYPNDEFIIITDDMMCTMRQGTDACLGDSGGPLFSLSWNADGSSDVVLVGIVSWGIGCVNPLLPSVHARISAGYAYEWMIQTICEISHAGDYNKFCGISMPEFLPPSEPLSPSPSSSPQQPISSLRPTASVSSESESSIITSIINNLKNCINHPTNWIGHYQPWVSCSIFDGFYIQNGFGDDDVIIINHEAIVEGCSTYGTEEDVYGTTLSQACCVCGGGKYTFIEANAPSSTPSLSFEPSESSAPTRVCTDVEDWTDPGGSGCEWFAEFNHVLGYDRCLLYGDIEGMDDLTARSACCICGGGIEMMMGLLQPSAAPSIIHSPAPSSKSMLNCDNNPPDFHIAAPLDVTCKDMEQEIQFKFQTESIVLFCNVYGYLMDANDVMARDACCVCGGGTLRSNVDTVVPLASAVPSVVAPPSSTVLDADDPTMDDNGGASSSSDDYYGAADGSVTSSSSFSVDSSLLLGMSLHGFVSTSTAVLMLLFLM